MKKLVMFLVSAFLPIVAFASSEKVAPEKSEKPIRESKTIYERLAEKGRAEIKESADSGRTGGGTKTSKLEH